MTLVFRSWKLGLISMLPNAFPLVTTAAWLVQSLPPWTTDRFMRGLPGKASD